MFVSHVRTVTMQVSVMREEVFEVTVEIPSWFSAGNAVEVVRSAALVGHLQDGLCAEMRNAVASQSGSTGDVAATDTVAVQSACGALSVRIAEVVVTSSPKGVRHDCDACGVTMPDGPHEATGLCRNCHHARLQELVSQREAGVWLHCVACNFAAMRLSID